MKTKLSKQDNNGIKRHCTRDANRVRVYQRSENGSFTTLEDTTFPSVAKAKEYFGAL